MEGYTGTISPPGMYVRAVYDYNADDRTSLSFRGGDIIQVLTQLESGWWDGVIDGQRGWFPSNYCKTISEEEAALIDQGLPPRQGTDADDLSSEGDVDGQELDQAQQSHLASINDQQAQHDQEETAFWIPQATPDGRLFYFNTMTGVSAMELPLESAVPPILPNSPQDGFRGSANAFASNKNGLHGLSGSGALDENDYSASEAEERSPSGRSMVSLALLNYRALRLPFAAKQTCVLLVRRSLSCHLHRVTDAGR